MAELTPSQIIEKINAWVTTNGEKQNTGAHLNIILNAIMEYVGVGYAFMGEAPSSAPSPDVPVVYLAGPGDYTEYSNSVISVDYGFLCVFLWNGTWSNLLIEIKNHKKNLLDFEVKGFYSISNNVLTYNDRPNGLWRTNVISVDILKSVELYTSDIPAIIYLTDAEPTESNRIAGAEQYATGSGVIRHFTDDLVIPSGAKYALISGLIQESLTNGIGVIELKGNIDKYVTDTLMYYQYMSIPATKYDTPKTLLDFAIKGFYSINDNALTYNDRPNGLWRSRVFSVEVLKAVKVLTSQAVPAIIYLTDADPTESNRIAGAEQYATGSTTVLWFDDDLVVPSNAKFAIVNGLIQSQVSGGNGTIKVEGSIEKLNMQNDADFVAYCYNLRHLPLNYPMVIVDKNGRGDYTTIQSAIDNTTDGTTILICPGTYEEAVEMWGKVRHLVGVDKETCILTNGTGAYDTPPLEANIGSVKNLTIIADNYDPTIPDPSAQEGNSPGSYGIHIEDGDDEPFEFVVENCKIISKWSAALGIGLRYNQSLYIRNCELISNSVKLWSRFSNKWVYMGGLYWHNDASVTPHQDGGFMRVENCYIRGKACAITAQSMNYGVESYVEFIGNTASCEDHGVGAGVIYDWDRPATGAGRFAGTDILLEETSHGNNISQMNA